MNNILSEKEDQIIKDILIELLGVTPDQLTPNARLAEDLGADSLTLAELMMALEDRFGMRIPDDRADSVKTVADVYQTVAEFLATPRR